jgi:aminomethyltransferase
MSEAGQVKRTALYECHVEAGAKMVPFAGYEMPIQYESIKSEHMAVRQAVGLFDVSHMGEITFKGPAALAVVQRLVSNDASRLGQGQAMYSGLLYENGTYVDDVLVYKLGDTEYMFCVNASNADKDFAWIQKHGAGDVTITNISSQITQIAIQGPKSAALLAMLTPLDPLSLRYYWSTYGDVCGHRMLISRTGYTGELGFELYMKNEYGQEIWRELMRAGKPLGVRPIGLGARDTLRLEAGMPLYGHDIDDTTAPMEAGLAWTVKLKKGPFNGSKALEAQYAAGVTRKLVGLEMAERRIPRPGQEVRRDGRRIGHVTSGGPGFAIDKIIGLAYVGVDHAAPGTELAIDLRGQEIPAHVVPLPFYSQTRKG